MAQSSEIGDLRHTDVALVLIALGVKGVHHWLLRADPSWGDWTFVGGHVEPSEQADWKLSAARETDEEMAPLRCGRELEVTALDLAALEWGPVPSRSAGGRLTLYRAGLFMAAFLIDPRECLSALSGSDFRFFSGPEIAEHFESSSIVRRALAMVDAQQARHIASWAHELDELPRFTTPLA